MKIETNTAVYDIMEETYCLCVCNDNFLDLKEWWIIYVNQPVSVCKLVRHLTNHIVW